MKKIALIALLALIGCTEEKRREQEVIINEKLPEGCTMKAVGAYGEIDQIVVIFCDGLQTVSTNGVIRRTTGKVTTEHTYTAVQIGSGA